MTRETYSHRQFYLFRALNYLTVVVVCGGGVEGKEVGRGGLREGYGRTSKMTRKGCETQPHKNDSVPQPPSSSCFATQSPNTHARGRGREVRERSDASKRHLRVMTNPSCFKII